MLVINEIAGNINDESWISRYNEMNRLSHVTTIMFTRLESERALLLKKLPESDEEIGINLKRGIVLHDGDILYYKTDEMMLVAGIEPEEMMVFEMVGELYEDTMFESVVRLGHAIGNQHWQIKVVEGKVYVPLTIDKNVMESVMQTHNIPGIKYRFMNTISSQIFNREYKDSFNTSHNHHSHNHLEKDS